jgi:phenylacetate-CoA ligase
MNPHSTYFDHADPQSLARDYSPGDEFLASAKLSRDETRARQETRFARVMDRAWRMGFYKRLWGGKGIERGDIKGLDDLTKLPTFEKSDIVASIAAHPPFGDFAGLDSYAPAERPPVILHTTSGTTGKPQPLLFGPRTREVQNLLLGRLYRFQGLRPDDVAHSVYGHGMINGGHYIRESVTHWTGATFRSSRCS